MSTYQVDFKDGYGNWQWVLAMYPRNWKTATVAKRAAKQYGESATVKKVM